MVLKKEAWFAWSLKFRSVQFFTFKSWYQWQVITVGYDDCIKSTQSDLLFLHPAIVKTVFISSHTIIWVDTRDKCTVSSNMNTYPSVNPVISWKSSTLKVQTCNSQKGFYSCFVMFCCGLEPVLFVHTGSVISGLTWVLHEKKDTIAYMCYYDQYAQHSHPPYPGL